MTTDRTPTGEDHHDDTIDAWMAALQGQDTMPRMTAAARSGTLLRALVMQAQGASAAANAAQTQALLARWAAQGLLQGRPARTGGRPWLQAALHAALAWLPTGPARGGLAALALVGGLGLWIADSHSPNEPAGSRDAGVSRGAERPLTINADDPVALALRVEAVLQQAAIVVRRTDLSSGAVQLQASVPADAQRARQALAALGVAVPDHGRLDLVITRPR